MPAWRRPPVPHRPPEVAIPFDRTAPGSPPGVDVLAANRAFYEAFEAGDLDAMSDLWSHGEEVVCTHPGWGSLRGWGAVAASFLAMFADGPGLQFILTDVVAEVAGDVAWVTLDENVLHDEIGGTAATLNLFRRDGGRWRMVAHHASPVAVGDD